MATYALIPGGGGDPWEWHRLVSELASREQHQEPLEERVAGRLDPAALRRVVGKMVDKFKTLVEANRLSRLLYNDDGTRRPEKIAQLAFYGLADAYCEANNFDVSPEADAGAGPVDFKISSGYDYRVTVEVKLSSNTALVRGFENQLPAYEAAENAFHSVYLVIRNGPVGRRLKELDSKRAAAVKGRLRVPEVVIVDGRIQPSASKRWGAAAVLPASRRAKGGRHGVVARRGRSVYYGRMSASAGSDLA